MTTIAVSSRQTAIRIALLHGDTLAEYALWNPAAPDGVGDIYTGRVTARIPAMAGSFLDLGNTTGFLPDSAGGGSLSEGQSLAVTITRAAHVGSGGGGKGPRLAAAADAPLAKPGLIRRGPGPLLELAARFPNAPLILDSHALIATLRPHLEARMTYRAAAFDPILEDEIAALAAPTATLPGGALMHIEPTQALTAIDIDAGAATAAAGAKSHAQATLNAALIPELARQIVLRNLSGAILIDFAGMKPKARAALLPPLAAALARDPRHPRLLGLTALGFAEISRPRIRPPLHELLRQDAP